MTYQLGKELQKPVIAGSDTHQAVQYGCIRTLSLIHIQMCIRDRYKYPQNGQYRSSFIFYDIDSDGSEAVSYTHLDVYKRQGSYCGRDFNTRSSSSENPKSSSGSPNATGKHICGKSTHHQLCPFPSPMVNRTALYSPAGMVNPSDSLVSKYIFVTQAVTFCSVSYTHLNLSGSLPVAG